MRSFKLIALLTTLLALGLVGCSRDSGPVSPAAESDATPGPLFGWQLPAEATLTSATLKVYVVDSSYQTVNAYRLTRDWEETTVTWDNFLVDDGGAYDPAVLATFTANFGAGYASMDVTAPVLAWMNGEADNFGFLLRQPLLDSPRTEMLSRERDTNRPVLELVYTLNGETTTEVIEPLGDAQINAAEPTTAFGLFDKLYAGWREAGEKVSLIRFDLDVVPPDDEGDEGCTRTIGYWKTHAGFGPQDDEVTPLLGNGIWLGNAGGAKSLAVTDRFIARDALAQNVYGSPSNGITKLYAQLLGAKLNVAAGASDDDVAAVIAAADGFLANRDWRAWSNLGVADRAMVNGWHAVLDDYNNGLIGPGHCDDSDDSDDCDGGYGDHDGGQGGWGHGGGHGGGGNGGGHGGGGNGGGHGGGGNGGGCGGGNNGGGHGGGHGH